MTRPPNKALLLLLCLASPAQAQSGAERAAAAGTSLLGGQPLRERAAPVRVPFGLDAPCAGPRTGDGGVWAQCVRGRYRAWRLETTTERGGRRVRYSMGPGHAVRQASAAVYARTVALCSTREGRAAASHAEVEAWYVAAATGYAPLALLLGDDDG